MRRAHAFILLAAALSFSVTLASESRADEADLKTPFVCAAVNPCGENFEVKPSMDVAPCGGENGVYRLRCKKERLEFDNFRLALENQQLKEAAKHHHRRDRRKNRKHA